MFFCFHRRSSEWRQIYNRFLFLFFDWALLHFLAKFRTEALHFGMSGVDGSFLIIVFYFLVDLSFIIIISFLMCLSNHPIKVLMAGGRILISLFCQLWEISQKWPIKPESLKKDSDNEQLAILWLLFLKVVFWWVRSISKNGYKFNLELLLSTGGWVYMLSSDPVDPVKN